MQNVGCSTMASTSLVCTSRETHDMDLIDDSVRAVRCAERRRRRGRRRRQRVVFDEHTIHNISFARHTPHPSIVLSCAGAAETRFAALSPNRKETFALISHGLQPNPSSYEHGLCCTELDVRQMEGVDVVTAARFPPAVLTRLVLFRRTALTAPPSRPRTAAACVMRTTRTATTETWRTTR